MTADGGKQEAQRLDEAERLVPIKRFLNRLLALSPVEWSTLNRPSADPSLMRLSATADAVGLGSLHRRLMDRAEFVACRLHVESAQRATAALLLRDAISAAELEAAYGPFSDAIPLEELG